MKDKTFKSRDIYRIVANNLDKSEKRNVLIFFIILLPMSGVVLDWLELFFTTTFPPSKVIFLILRLIRLFKMVMERLFDVDTEIAIWLLLPKEDRKEAMEAIDKLQADFFLLR